MSATGLEPDRGLGGVATGIGSLPHTDPSTATALVLERQPDLPAAPSLPRRSVNEGMLAQGAWGVAGTTIGPDGTLFVDLDRLDPEAPLGDPGFEGDAFVGLRVFLGAVADRTEPIKLQLTGPVTLGLALHNAGAPADLAFGAAASAVQQRIPLLQALLATAVPAADAVVFLDEPGLTGAGHPGFPITLTHAMELLAASIDQLGRWAVPGVHCCGRADWSAVLATGPRVLSLTTDAAADLSASILCDFLEDNGWVAWGAVPTDGPVGTGVERLCRSLAERWRELVRDGCDPVQLSRQALFTPACGLAGHGESQAELVLSITADIAAGLRHHVLARNTRP